MNTNTKTMAITGAGLIVAGIGVSLIGAALILPAAVSLAASVIEKAGGRLMSEIERGSRVIGTTAGILQRSFAEAARAGITEIRGARPSSDEAI